MIPFQISPYKPEHDDQLFALLEREGEEWKDYWCGPGRTNYQRALGHSIAYLILEAGHCLGYVRCRDDDGYGIYVYDLLVDRQARGKEYGRLLMERVCHDFPGNTIYVMSDVDAYYQKLGYEKAGSVFVVTAK